MCSGYYNYAKGYKPEFKDEEVFRGKVVHPQHWPEELDYTNKRVIVIGSGATAVTMVPVMAETAARVTMLQRSPTFMVSRPSIDRFAQFLRKILPTKMSYAMIRWRNIWLQRFIYRRARANPASMSEKIIALARKEMPNLADFEEHFTPRYAPWEQRLCLVPDGDMFKTLANGKAQIVTEQIECFTEKGILLESGKELEADIIVTATGLNLSVLGQLKLSINGTGINIANHVWYKGVMFNDIPNMFNIFGYVNASWTLKTDIVADYVCRLLMTMDEKKKAIATPHLVDSHMTRLPFVENFSSGYIARSLDKLPKNGDRHPWRLLQDYAADKKILTQEPVDDGVMVFSDAKPILG
jgi:cation diffusion facilitator CzcD-associated flavoprotein CzcO